MPQMLGTIPGTRPCPPPKGIERNQNCRRNSIRGPGWKCLRITPPRSVDGPISFSQNHNSAPLAPSPLAPKAPIRVYDANPSKSSPSSTQSISSRILTFSPILPIPRMKDVSTPESNCGASSISPAAISSTSDTWSTMIPV